MIDGRSACLRKLSALITDDQYARLVDACLPERCDVDVIRFSHATVHGTSDGIDRADAHASSMQRITPVVLAVLAACARPHHGVAGYPLLDGKCDDYANARSRTPIANGIVLFELQDDDYVWLCYTIPPGSDGTMDMWIAAPGLGSTALDLHVSSTVGEWPASATGEKTAAPDGTEWWNHRGWAANWIGLTDLVTVAENGQTKTVPQFQTQSGRELQLAKWRFGRGTWRYWIEIRRIRGRDGRLQTVRYPDRGTRVLTVS
jgi:hypothetical protein